MRMREANTGRETMNHGVDADPIPDEGARLTHADANGEEGDEGFTKGLSASEPIWGSDDADDPAVDWDSARQALKSCETDDSMTVETGRWPRFFRHPSSIAVMVLCVLLGLTFVAMWFVPRAARRGLYGLWAALLLALAMTLLFRALGIRRRRVTGTPARALAFFAWLLLAAAASLCLAYGHRAGSDPCGGECPACVRRICAWVAVRSHTRRSHRLRMRALRHPRIRRRPKIPCAGRLGGRGHGRIRHQSDDQPCGSRGRVHRERGRQPRLRGGLHPSPVR